MGRRQHEKPCCAWATELCVSQITSMMPGTLRFLIGPSNPLCEMVCPLRELCIDGRIVSSSRSVATNCGVQEPVATSTRAAVYTRWRTPRSSPGPVDATGVSAKIDRGALISEIGRVRSWPVNRRVRGHPPRLGRCRPNRPARCGRRRRRGTPYPAHLSDVAETARVSMRQLQDLYGLPLRFTILHSFHYDA